MSFYKFDLDERLLKAIAEIGWEKPTQIQDAMIPLALEDKNILARARTGSGKTGAFLLPIIQKILQITALTSKKAIVSGCLALIIAPTKELANQIYNFVLSLTKTIPFFQSINLSFNEEICDVKGEKFDIVVSTPGRLITALQKNGNLLNSIKYVVLDEADLLFSYGYKNEMKRIKSVLPSFYQTIMTSATLSEDLSEVQNLFVVGPVASIKLKEGALPSSDQLSHYHVYCNNNEERFTILLSLIKLKLLLGRSIIFVSSIERCYKLNLFLETFKISSCILNSQMPALYRCKIINEFNEGKYCYIIASESNDIFDEEFKEQKQNYNKKNRKQGIKKKYLDRESGIGRGIDFNYVSNVINFDFPLTTDIYVHRVGRTARGWNKGSAISLIGPEEKKIFEVVQNEINEQMGYVVMQPYEIRIKDFESFQLRAREVLAACTKTVIREARLEEIRHELLKSKQLESYFKKNPREKEVLEQDKKKFKLNVYSAGIADVPDYIVPKALRTQNYQEKKNFNTKSKRNWKRKHAGETLTIKQKKYRKKASDPLESFNF